MAEVISYTEPCPIGNAADGTTFANTGSTTTLGVLIGADDADGATATAKTFGTFAFTPSAAGSYTIRVFNDQSGDGNVSPAEGFQDIVVAVGSAASALCLSCVKAESPRHSAICSCSLLLQERFKDKIIKK